MLLAKDDGKYIPKPVGAWDRKDPFRVVTVCDKCGHKAEMTVTADEQLYETLCQCGHKGCEGWVRVHHVIGPMGQLFVFDEVPA